MNCRGFRGSEEQSQCSDEHSELLKAGPAGHGLLLGRRIVTGVHRDSMRVIFHIKLGWNRGGELYGLLGHTLRESGERMQLH